MGFSGFKTGTYIPNAGKCKRTKAVKYRSSYEAAFCSLLDKAPQVIAWEFEVYYIGYNFHGKHHHYLVDFYLEMQSGEKFLIEIKPMTF